MDKHYTLTSHERIFRGAGDRTAVIGSIDGCDLSLADRTPAFDAVVAKIKPDTDGRGWHIIRCCPAATVFVNGEPLNRVCYLTDGDVIEAAGSRFTYRFGIRSIELIAGKGLFLNGRRVMCKGMNLHHDLGVCGAAAFEVL